MGEFGNKKSCRFDWFSLVLEFRLLSTYPYCLSSVLCYIAFLDHFRVIAGVLGFNAGLVRYSFCESV